MSKECLSGVVSITKIWVIGLSDFEVWDTHRVHVIKENWQL